MQKYAIKMSDLAENDLENAGDYIALVLINPIAAKNTVNGIREEVNKLQYFPESHELDEDPMLAEFGIRKTYFKDYKIFFWINHAMRVVYAPGVTTSSCSMMSSASFLGLFRSVKMDLPLR